MATDGYEWDPRKATENLRKHGVDFGDAVVALEDPLALTMLDPDSNGEVRFVSIGRDAAGRLLVTIFTPRVARAEPTVNEREKGIRLLAGTAWAGAQPCTWQNADHYPPG